MRRVRIVIDRDIELYSGNEIELGIEYLVSDFINPTQRSGSHTKDITIPITAVSAEVFDYFHNANSKGKGVNLKVVKIFIDETLYLIGTGKLILSYKGFQPQHFILQVLSNNLEWIKDIDQRYLSELDLGAHIYDKATVENSWVNKSINAVYCPINYGEWEKVNYISLTDLRPSVFISAIFEKAFAALGYKIKSNWLFTGQGSKLIFPFIGEKWRQPEEYIEPLKFRAGRNYVTNVNQVPSLTVPFQDDSTYPNFDNGGNYSGNTYIVLVAAQMRFKAQFGINDAGPDAENIIFHGYIIRKRGTAETIIAKKENNMLTPSKHTDIWLDSNYWNFEAGDQVFVRVVFDQAPTNAEIKSTGYFYNEVTDKIVEGATIDLAKMLPEGLSQLWLIKNIALEYGLHFTTNNVRREVTIEPFADFHLPINKAYDWSKKIDRSKGVEDRTIGHDMLREQLFTFAKDEKDGYVKALDVQTELPFHSQLYELNDRFTKGREEIKIDFAATAMMKELKAVASGDMWLPRMWKDFVTGSDYPEKTYDFKPRVLHYSGIKTGINWRWYSAGNIVNGYPYAYSVDYGAAADNSSSNAFNNHTLANGIELKGLFYRYHYPYYYTIQNGRLRRCYVWLDPAEIESLNLRQLVRIEDEDGVHYWRINKVEVENALEYAPARVELLKYVPVKSSYIKPKKWEEIPVDRTPDKLIAFGGKVSDSAIGEVIGVERGIRLLNGSGSLALKGISLGIGTVSLKEGQVVLGAYNVPDEESILVIGTGDEAEQMTAFSVKKAEDGTVSAWIGGTTELLSTENSKEILAKEGFISAPENPIDGYVLVADSTSPTGTNWRELVAGGSEWNRNGNDISYIDGKVSVGVTAASATLHIRGAGTTGSTTAFLVQNNEATPKDLIKVTDYGDIYLFQNMLGRGIHFGNQSSRIFNNNGVIDMWNIRITGGSLGSMMNGNMQGFYNLTNLQIGQTTFQSGYSGALVLRRANQPTGNTIDTISIYAADIVAGNSVPHFRTEDGSIIKLYKYQAVSSPQGIADALTAIGLLEQSVIAISGVGDETDPVFSASPASSISMTNIAWWNEAYNWGDHSLAGYLSDETDPTVPEHVKSITTIEKNNWNTAFSWGDHSAAGYLTSQPWENSNSDIYYSAGKVGIGAIPSASVHVRGIGTTSSSHAFQVENNAAIPEPIFRVRDDGWVTVKPTGTNSANGNVFTVFYANNSESTGIALLHLYKSGSRTYMNSGQDGNYGTAQFNYSKFTMSFGGSKLSEFTAQRIFFTGNNTLYPSGTNLTGATHSSFEIQKEKSANSGVRDGDIGLYINMANNLATNQNYEYNIIGAIIKNNQSSDNSYAGKNFNHYGLQVYVGGADGRNVAAQFYDGNIEVLNGSNVTLNLGVNGEITSAALAGVGTRMVVADANGLLGTQAIPSGGGGTPAGANGDVQINEYGNFGVVSGFKSDGMYLNLPKYMKWDNTFQIYTMGWGNIMRGISTSGNAIAFGANYYVFAPQYSFSALGIGVNSTTDIGSARLLIRGKGTTASTKALEVQNNAATPQTLFEVIDNGNSVFYSNLGMATGYNLGVNGGGLFSDGRGMMFLGNIIAEPTTGQTDNVGMYGVKSSDLRTTLGLFMEQDVEPTERFVPDQQLKIKVNGRWFYLALHEIK